MIDALLARADTRFVFVVGKGGVGKTTTAGALALALADRGAGTHLISTDPAHSIGDLFGQELPDGRPAASRCSRRLVLEEFSARAYADALFAELRAPLIGLIERGTYLDATDAADFLDLSVPGIDEVMSALRLADLHDGGSERIVVDTAPTGHTLRLLTSSPVIEGWVAAGRAMARKAQVVATHLVGSGVRFPAEDILERLVAKATAFERAILPQAAVIVVTRPGTVTAAETERLLAALRTHGIGPPTVLSVGGGAGGADFVIAAEQDPCGCAGLRRWPSQLLPGAATTASAHPASATGQQNAAAWISGLSAPLLVVAGKGGVGKTTCAAAVAAGLATSRRVCLISTDPAGSLSEVLGTPIGEDLTEAAPGLFARQLDAAAEFERMRVAYRSAIQDVLAVVGLQAELDRDVLESFFDFAPPGVDEVIALAEIITHTGEFDTLIVDTAPTGHFLRLIELPAIALDWVHALLRLLVKYGAVASLDALARDLLAFAKRLRQLKLDLSTQARTAVFVVTLDEPMVRAETERLSSALAHAGVPVAATILNRCVAGPPVKAGAQHLIHAPDHGREIVGTAALRSFLARWSINVE